MVSFTSISQGVNLILVVSSLIVGLSQAAPATTLHTNATSVNSTVSDTDYVLPPLITSRTKPSPKGKNPGDFDIESEFIAKNTQWYAEHGGSYNFTKRADIETVGGMTMELPPNPPPLAAYPKDVLVVKASTAQIKEFTKYAGLAAAGYCRDVVPANNWKCKQCLKWVPDGKLIYTFTSLVSDTNGFIMRSDKEKVLYLVFRGTNSIRNAITDIQFDLTSYPNVKGAKVHRGFLNSYNEVVRSFFPIMQDQITAFPGYKVTVVGHSLGGAQALIAGMDLYQRDSRMSPKNLSIWTIGSPRVGNPAFAYYVDSTKIPYYRSVNQRDVVPHLPPQAVGYLHPGVEAWIKSPGSVQICTQTIESDLCSNTIVPFTTIIDHLSYYDINQGLCL